MDGSRGEGKVELSTEREYYEQSYANKFGNLEEMEKFLEINSPPRFHQEVNNFEHKHH